MSESVPETKQPSRTQAPRYSPTPKRGVFQASFADGTVLELEPGRSRAYPGLRGQAPSMLAFYDAFADFVGVGRFLDAGSGVGLGALRLGQRGLHVIAVDEDLTAIEFARRHCPDAEHQHKNLAALELASPADGAIIADVLGMCEDPEPALAGVARALRLGAPLLVAEPAAHVSQRLSVPQRRGFSVPRLRSLLVRTGFEVEAVIADRVPFVALLARAAFPQVRAAFAEAYAAAASGELDRAVNELNRARGTGRFRVEAEILLAEAELRLVSGDGDRAANAFFRTRELDAEDPRPLVGLGRIALASGNHGDALELALDALRCDPTDPTAYVLVALASSALGHADSFSAWRAAARLAPDDSFVVGELTRAALARGDHPVALGGLDQLERYGVPLEAAHHVTRAWLLLALGRRNEATIEARIARAKQSTHPELGELERALAER
ncbi:MAG TPA: methyltransferase domain-containing protein [Polyangiaceae bacterium]|nr:methyltransferase domain-containing protein [Polyangiaceae bacterium]